MAIKKVIEIDVDELQALGGLENLNKAVNQTEKQTESLKSQLREATQELIKAQAEFGDYSQAALDAAKKVAGLKDQIQEAKETSQLFDPGAKFAAATGAIAAGANAVQTYQAALGLVGVEGEAVQETLLKVQSAMAFSQGLSSLADSAKDFKRLSAVAQQYTIVQKALTAGQWLWNAAMSANPIGLLVTAIAALIAGGYALTKYFSENAEAAKKNTSAVEANRLALEKQNKALDSNANAFNRKQNQELAMAKASGASAEAIRKLELKLIDEKIAFEKSQRAIAENTYQKNLNTLASLKAADADADLIKKQTDITNESIKAYNKQNQDVKKALDEKKDIQNRHLVEIKTAETQSAKEIAQKRKEQQDKAREELKKLQEQEKEELKRQKEALKNIEQNALKSIEDLKAKTELEKIELQKGRDLAELDAFKLKEEEKEKARLAILEKYKILETEAKIKDAEAKEKEEEEFWNKEAEKAIARDEAYKERKEAEIQKEIEFEKRKNEAIAASKENLNNIIAGLEQSGIANTKAGQAVAKAIALTQIGIDSAVAISKASTLANAEGVAAQLAFPLVPGIGTIARVTSYASTALSVISNIARAKKLLSGGGSGGGGAVSGGSSVPSGGVSTTNAPQFNVVGNAGVNQIQDTLGNRQPVQAYVVGNQVTTQQALDRNIVQNASLG